VGKSKKSGVFCWGKRLKRVKATRRRMENRVVGKGRGQPMGNSPRRLRKKVEGNSKRMSWKKKTNHPP